MLIELAELRDKVAVFDGRPDAGQRLASMLAEFKGGDGIVLAIPSGGVPVAAAVAEQLDLTLDVAVVSKITLPWNTEAGFGAVAFDGTVRLNEEMLAIIEINEVAKQLQIEQTREKVERRVKEFRHGRPFPKLAGREVILVDDGIASGFTILVAIEAMRNQGAERIIIAVPTAHPRAIELLADQVEAIYCANVRGGGSFAVAAAYRQWRDVDEAEAMQILRAFEQSRGTKQS